jgi:hypothetical protein
MNRDLLKRLEILEGRSPDEASELIRQRLQELGIGADPFDQGTHLLVESIIAEIRK